MSKVDTIIPVPSFFIRLWGGSDKEFENTQTFCWIILRPVLRLPGNRHWGWGQWVGGKWSGFLTVGGAAVGALNKVSRCCWFGNATPEHLIPELRTLPHPIPCISKATFLESLLKGKKKRAARAAAAAKSLQSCLTLCDPIDGSPPGSPVPGILQARTLEWVAISFSNAWKWKVKEKSLSRVWLVATPWTAAYQACPAMGFSRQEYWSGVPLPSTWKVPSESLVVHKFKNESESQSCRTLCDPMNFRPAGSPVHEILQARILECSLSVLQGIFLTQESNQGLLHGKRILHWLSYLGNPQV